MRIHQNSIRHKQGTKKDDADDDADVDDGFYFLLGKLDDETATTALTELP